MPYEFDEDSRAEAADHGINAADAKRLRVQCTRKELELGPGGVRNHAVKFSFPAWNDPPGSLPSVIPRDGCISRGDVLDVGADVRDGKRRATDLLTASFIWGTGPTGYGPRRYRDLVTAADDHLESALQRVLKVITENSDGPGIIAGYAQLYGGYEPDKRAIAGQEPWSRTHGFGPAFFTKFLYFSTPGALILDNRLATAVHALSGLDYLITDDGRSCAWSPYRYAVYLHWMHQTSRALSVPPDLLEATLFSPPADPLDEHDAAD
ncbi:MAG TPA: hypothetical protein VMV92_08165 [Streptosporangiaceae bacterium]|nr:hypothetical protein [Streptosporangiaceae bacterium]